MDSANYFVIHTATTGYLMWKKSRVMLRPFPVTSVTRYGLTFTFI